MTDGETPPPDSPSPSAPNESWFRRWTGWPPWVLTALVVVAAVIVALVLTRSPSGSGGSAGVQLPNQTVTSSPVSPTASGTFDFTTPEGLQMSVRYAGTTFPSCVVSASQGFPPSFASDCKTARTDNLVAFQFIFTNVGQQIVTSFAPYALFLTLNGPSGSTNPQIGFNESGITNLLPGDQITLTTGVQDLVPGASVTSLILVPNSGSAEPYPTWPVSVAGSDSWCAQEQNPSPCQLAYLGVEVQNVQVGGTPEVQIVSVVSGSPADASGLQFGDVVAAIDGTRVTSSATFSSIVTSHHPGSVLQLSIDRGGQQMTVPVTLGLAPTG